MDSTDNKQEYDVRAISRVLLDRAKLLWIVSLTCKGVGTILATISVLFGVLPTITPIVILVIGVAAEYFGWASDAVKGVGEALRRKLDAEDSFGWTISNTEIADLVAEYQGLKTAFQSHSTSVPYFGSSEPVGASRALHNVRESTWWSKHLARLMGKYCAISLCTLIALSICLLLISFQTIQNYGILAAIGRCASAAITLVLSLGLVRLTLAYYAFRAKCEKMQEQAQNLLNSGQTDDIKAIKLMYEYQFARASAPLIPTYIWKRNQDHLNEIWDRTQKP